ncbi:MAG: cytochrome c oxidase subunit II [Polyangiaceae bacterium]
MSDTAAAAADTPKPSINIDSFWLPRQSSTFAKEVDEAYYITLAICIGFFIIVVGAMIYFAIKYKRKRDDDRTSPVDHNFRLEIVWSTIPSLLLVWLFYLGLKGYANSQTAPNGAFEIRVTGQMWNWSFSYPNGSSTDELFVPVDRPVKLVMTSADVIHSFYVPEFRVKQDVVPGMYSSLWFTATQVGDTAVECAEYCGDGHSQMFNIVHVMDAAKFDEFYANDFDDPAHPMAPEVRGEKKYKAKCAVCHSTDGSPNTGPTFKGVWGREEKLEDGSTITVDEAYVRKSILEPQSQVVATFPHSMPSFAGQLKEKDIEGIIAFLKQQ